MAIANHFNNTEHLLQGCRTNTTNCQVKRTTRLESKLLVYWQVSYWCTCPPSLRSQKMWEVETNVDKLFCKVHDKMSRNNRGQKADSHFPGTFLLVSDVLYVTELSKWNGKYPPKTTFQSRVNAAGSVCDISQHYTGLLVYFFFNLKVLQSGDSVRFREGEQ